MATTTSRTTTAKKTGATTAPAVAPTRTPEADTATKNGYQDKAPTARVVAMAEWITQTTGVEVTPKQVQVVLGLHEAFGRTDAAKAIAAQRSKASEVAEAKKREALEARIAKLQAQLEKS